MQFFKDEQLYTSEFCSTCVMGTGLCVSFLLCVSRSGMGAGSLRVLAATACGSSLPRSVFPLCGSTLCLSPFSLVAGNSPGVTSLLREQYSKRTVISYNLNKRSCMLIWLLFKYRRGAERQRRMLQKCLS